MKMLIGGKPRDASSGETMEDRNPATGEFIDKVPAATAKDVEEALMNSRKGFLEWSKTPLYKRLEILYRYADLLEENKDELTELMCRESGKSIALCRGELQ